MVEVLQGISSEITVDKEGKGSITKYGLANLLGISRSLLNGDRMAKNWLKELMLKDCLMVIEILLLLLLMTLNTAKKVYYY
jgi:hypothetical protein